jgi:cytochrome c556
MGKAGWIAAAVSLLAATASPAPPQDPLAGRRAGEHRAGEIMRDLRQAVLAGGDVVPLAGQAQLVADWAKQLPALFPPGSDRGETNALPSVWSDRAGFEAMARALAEQAGRLAAAARAGDRAGFAAAYRATAGACGECHRAFRQR